MPGMCYPDRAAWLCLQSNQQISAFKAYRRAAAHNRANSNVISSTSQSQQHLALQPPSSTGPGWAALVETPWAQGKSWGLFLPRQKWSQAREKTQLEKQLCRLQHLQAQNLGTVLTSWWVFPRVTSSWCLDLSPVPNHSFGSDLNFSAYNVNTLLRG